MKIDFEKVLADYGLKAGDKIMFTKKGQDPCDKDIYETYFIIVENGCVRLKNCKLGFCIFPLELFEVEWDKVEPNKTVGDMNCGEIGCSKCPLQCIACEGNPYDTIRKRWIKTLNTYPQLEPMREYIETELDKEVE